MFSIKQIFSFVFLLIFTFSSFGFNLTNAINNSDSQKSEILKQIYVNKYDLEKIRNGKKYVTQIDTLVTKLDHKKLQILKDRILKLENSLSKNTDSKSKDLLKLLNYFSSKIDYSLYIYEIENSFLDTILNSDLSEAEKQKVEDEIVKLQLNLFEKGVDIIENIKDDFENLSNYEDKGNLKLDFNLDEETIGTIKSGLTFSNYSSKVSNYDSQLNGQLNAFIDADIAGDQDDINMQFSSFLDFISKDGNLYLLLKDLNITDEKSNEELKELIEKLKSIASENKYIKYEDKQTQKLITILKSINPNNIASNGRDIFGEAIFEAYKKQGDKYLLKPTKYACDKFKELANRFDPFYGKSCSNSQYEDLLKEYIKYGDTYIILGEKNEIGFEGNIDDVKLSGTVVYNENNIEQISFNIFPDQEKYPNEGLEFSYIKQNSIIFNLYADSGDIEYNFDSKLDSNNRFSYINFKGHTANSYEDFSIMLNLNNHNISGTYEINNSNYDYESKSYKKSTTINGNINGTTKLDNNLSTLVITLNGKKTEDKQSFIIGSFAYNAGFFKLKNDYNSVGNKYNLEIGGKWDSVNKYFSSFNYNLVYSKKDRTYNYDTWKYEYNGDFYEIVNSNLKLENNIISGNTLINNSTEEIVNITHSGNYEKNYLEFYNKFSFKDIIKYSETDYTGNLNITADTRDNKQNIKFYLDTYQADKKIIEYNIENEAIRKYAEININTPTNTIDYSDILQN
ncbi:MAG: hypothetical protein PHH06_04760 [Candidatus Gracilibacteria bacterium]|nr:hypothetical protein [Candidatus Gracilibacteria bacterium]